jgi:CheY-like chemotaxis protein
MAGGDESTGERAARGPRVLVVEDEALVVLALKDQLQSLGCEIVGSVPDADSAIELARSLQPDVVVMDLGLAGSSGTNAIRTIVAETTARVVVVTAYGGKRAREAEQAGAFTVLRKPVVAAQLGQAIREACGGAM